MRRQNPGFSRNFEVQAYFSKWQNNLIIIIFIAEKLMYLRIRMGQPLGSKIKRDETINSYGEATVKPDYWFILTIPRAEVVHDFFHNVSKDFKMYGVLDVLDVERAGLELVREGRDAMEPEAGRTCNRATVAKLDKQHFSFSSVDFSIIAPILGESELMSKEERIYLAKIMPQKLECHTWIPVCILINVTQF